MTWHEEMTPSEKEVVAELKRRTISDATPKMLEDDTVFYRFAKARDFNLQAAETMLRKHIAWRKEYRVDTILQDYNPPEVLRKYHPFSRLGFDKDGSPVRYIDFGRIDSRGIIQSAKMIDHIKYNVWINEQDMQVLKEQSEKLGKSITKVTFIENFEDLTFSTATHKATLEGLHLYATMYQDNYPERAKRVFIINVSPYFSLGFTFLKAILTNGLLQKMQIYGSTGWKEAIQQYIDADQLPAFLGGTQTDPDGNPLCNSFVIHGKTIPRTYYLRKSPKRLLHTPGVQHLTVTRFSREEISFEVDRPGSTLEWEFETKNRDIGFGFYFKDNTSGESELVELIPKQRLDSYYEPETGVYKCESPGTYIMVFDNSYSWFFSKEIYYRAWIRDPEQD